MNCVSSLKKNSLPLASLPSLAALRMDHLQRCPQEKYFPLNPTGIGVKGKEWTFPLLSVAAAPPLLPQRTLLASQNLPQQWSKIPFNHDLASGAEILRVFVLGRVED